MAVKQLAVEAAASDAPPLKKSKTAEVAEAAAGCAHCGTAAPGTGKFCIECGKNLSEAPAAEVDEPVEEEAAWGELEEEEAVPAKPAKKAKPAEPVRPARAASPTARKVSGAKGRRKANPDSLLPGTVVIYWDGYRGIVRDAFAPIDQFWLEDEESGELISDEAGSPVQFKSEELELVAALPIAKPRPEALRASPLGGVLVMGTEQQMVQVLQHFGAPSKDERNEPQQLVALPCHLCDQQNLLPTALDGVEPSVHELGKGLRPDIHVALRSFHLKQAIDQLGPDFIKLAGYYCLSAVHLPFNKKDIEAAATPWERHWRGDIRNQIDLCVTASGCWPEELSPEDAAKRALGEFCGMRISEVLWDDEVQQTIRKSLNAEGLKLHITDANCIKITALVLPEDAEIKVEDGLLCFYEGIDYFAEEAAPAEGADLSRQGVPAATPARSQEAGRASAMRQAAKTANDWEREQGEFRNEPSLPAGWMRVKSKSNGDVYFFHKETQKSQFDFPEDLPAGWTKEVSKSTGKVYYFNAKRKQSQFVRPTVP